MKKLALALSLVSLFTLGTTAVTTNAATKSTKAVTAAATKSTSTYTARITANAVALRRTPDASSNSNRMLLLNKGDEVVVTDGPISKNGYTWYKVTYRTSSGTYRGYVCSKYVQYIHGGGAA